MITDMLSKHSVFEPYAKYVKVTCEVITAVPWLLNDSNGSDM
jgi:hypothetical protein